MLGWAATFQQQYAILSRGHQLWQSASLSATANTWSSLHLKFSSLNPPLNQFLENQTLFGRPALSLRYRSLFPKENF